MAIFEGDVDFHAQEEIGGYIRTVPFGEGAMTVVSMLMKNMLQSLTYSLGIT